jgi:1-acyl-sn-glycerol-3-phosphate acyltransferase
MISTSEALWLIARSPRRWFRTLKVVSAFALFWTGGTLLAWTALPVLALVGGTQTERIRRCQRLLSASFRVFHGYMHALGLLRRRFVSAIPRPPGGGPMVIVANHTTLVDVTALLSALPHLRCLAKFQYATNPFFGRLLRLCGFISAGSDPMSAAAALVEAEACLRAGHDILIFPEGTRSPPGSISSFKRGAFELACRAGVPVLPLLLRCAPSALTKDRPWFFQPDHLAELTIEPQPFVYPEAADFRGARLRDLVFARYKEDIAGKTTEAETALRLPAAD